MNELLTVLNHLLAAWIAQGPGGAPAPAAASLNVVRLEEVHLEEDGFRVTGRLAHGAARGAFALRGRIEPAGPARNRVLIRLERCPEGLAAIVEPFRCVLESARMAVELDFGETGET